jgi:hypothetical protein
MTVQREILSSDTNPISERSAVAAVEGDSIWLYLTAPGGAGIDADCWLANTAAALSRDDLRARVEYYRSRSEPLPVPIEMLAEEALQGFALPTASTIQFRWTPAGDGVAALLDGHLWGFIAPGARHGASRDLVAEGPWGAPIDEDAARRMFGDL